jgi:hypothetical protein
MSDTTAIVLVFLLGVIFMGGCVIACVFIGRYYVRKCAKSTDYSAAVYERLTYLMRQFERKCNWVNEDTEIITRVPPLSTAGQRMRAGGRHAHPDNNTEGNERERI